MGIKNLVRLAVKGFGKEFKKNNKNKKSIDEKSKEFKKKQETRRFLKSDEYGTDYYSFQRLFKNSFYYFADVIK